MSTFLIVIESPVYVSNNENTAFAVQSLKSVYSGPFHISEFEASLCYVNYRYLIQKLLWPLGSDFNS